jgi:hypothetical protein
MCFWPSGSLVFNGLGCVFVFSKRVCAVNPNLKLYVWDEVLTDWTSGIIFALAKSEEQARELVMEENGESEYVRKEIAKAPKVYTTPMASLTWGGG